jgi:hypothetical protein
MLTPDAQDVANENAQLVAMRTLGGLVPNGYAFSQLKGREVNFHHAALHCCCLHARSLLC